MRFYFTFKCGLDCVVMMLSVELILFWHTICNRIIYLKDDYHYLSSL